MTHPEFMLVGDALWLDFVNSALGRTAAPPDLLPDPTAYARWTELHHLDASSDPTPFAQVREFRARLTELAEALHQDRQPPSGVIAALNEQLARSTGLHQLTRVAGEWRLRFAPVRPLAALEAIARSAAATLADARARVRRCAAETCTLFFMDDSLSGSRRWCDPEVCGRGARVERRRGLRR
jgi:predicted RNA-binding Zn ribbon-like protein